MKVALIVPGGVDRSGEYRVIPAIQALIKRLSRQHNVRVFALAQEPVAAVWTFAGAQVFNIGLRFTQVRAVATILQQNRLSPFDIIHAIWSGGVGLVAISAARLIGIPSVVHIAGGELTALPEIGYGGRLHWKGRVREALVLRAATAITAASTPVLEALAALGFSAQRVPLGVDLDTWIPCAPARRNTEEPARLIHVASLNRVKDQLTLLRALAAVASSGHRFRVDVVGEDTLHGAVQATARELGIDDRITFHGFVPQQQLRPIMAAAHLMVMSSRHETGPLAMLEAAVVGVPTVGTAVGHIAEWAPTASRSVAVGDPQQLAGAIRALLENEDLRLRIAHEAWHRATAEDADYTAAQVQRCYHELVN
jgi:glycosyltransferase involved in cell wall biosynthesis